MRVEATERRLRPLTRDQRDAIQGEPGFWRLADSGLVSYRRAGSGRHEIQGHQYVGRALIGDLELDIREKVPGTVLALSELATGSELRLEHEDSPSSDFDAVSRALMREFNAAAGRYIRDRRRPRFEYRDASGPVLAGTLDMAGTMRLHASGQLGAFAYRQGRVVRDQPLDRLALAGLLELERSAEVMKLDDSTVYQARSLSSALEEVRDQRFLNTSVSEHLESGVAIEEASRTAPADTDLARLAAIALLHKGFELDNSPDENVPRACFLNLEILFERAVREVMGSLVAKRLVDRGESFDRLLFTGGHDRSRTNPDLVVHRDHVVSAVGDVKYKTPTAPAEYPKSELGSRKVDHRPDLYQVLVHAASLGATRAFLVYPGDKQYSCRYCGSSSTGAHTWIAQVRATHLEHDLGLFLAEIDLLDGS